MFDTYEEIFAARAGSYQQAMEEMPHARDREFMAMVDALGDIAGQSLCDMPAGGGYLHRYLPPGVRYIAVEPSPTFVSNCPQGPDYRAVQAPIEQVPLDDGSVHCIVSLAGLHHCPDLPAVFREMRRLVRAGGTVVIADVEEGTAPASFLNGYVDAHNPLGHRGTFLNGTIAGLLREAALKPVADQLIDIPWSFTDARQAGLYCIALFGLEGVAPEDVAIAMARQLGTCDGAEAHNVKWQLRRITCTAV
ncbi:class I SAM-dependent methyltransferase [Sphingomonas sp. ASY06-1R]|jgi:SAM-dependent methyltransferase|uniref:class I SAM-dependent methyltransferase n=1 Tax=Sphingomonas sp. ASY06-1R TaxID=3445771 RepID=UPI003FA31268